VPDNAHHGSDKVNAVPGRGKDVHAPKLHDSIHASSGRQRGEFLFSRRVSHGEPQGLHVSVELFEGLSQVIHFENAKRFALGGLRNFRPAPDKKCPIRRGGENSTMSNILQQPGGPHLANGGCRASVHGLAGMELIFKFECGLERVYELVAGKARLFFQEKYLG